jgi:hypothetical protein
MDDFEREARAPSRATPPERGARRAYAADRLKKWGVVAHSPKY